MVGRDIRRKHNQKCNYGKILAGQIGALQSLMWQTQCRGHEDQPTNPIALQTARAHETLVALGKSFIIKSQLHQDFAISESLLGRNQRLRYACVIVCSMGELLV